MRIRHSIVFSPKADKGKKTLFIRARISYAGYRPHIATGFEVDPKFWDASKNRVSPAYDGARKINSGLADIESIIGDIFARFELIEKRIPEPEEVKALFKARKDTPKGREKPPSLFDTFDQFVRTASKQNSWDLNTIGKFNNLKAHLLAFDRKLSMSALTEDKMNGFLQHLIATGMVNSTIAKNLSYFRRFLRWSAYRGLYTGHQHEMFKPRLKGIRDKNKEIIFLTWDELMKLYELELKPSTHDLRSTLDTFLFCCFSGLRHSDVYRLKKTDVHAGHISVITRKDDELLKIDLNKYSKAILEKYTTVDLPKDKALPAFTNQKMNDHLKLIGEQAGLTTPVRVVSWSGGKRTDHVFPKHELLTTHAGRRTFIVNGLYLGISTEVIMKWTGHADYNAMKPYIAIVDDLKSQEMKKFDR